LVGGRRGRGKGVGTNNVNNTTTTTQDLRLQTAFMSTADNGRLVFTINNKVNDNNNASMGGRGGR